MKRMAILGLMAVAACSDALDQDTTAGQVIAVAEEGPFKVSLVSAANLAVSQAIPLPDGAAVGPVSGLGSVLIVAIAHGIAVIDLTQSTTSVTRFVQLDPGGGSLGTAIQDDAIAWIAYPPAAVWRVNYRSGDTASVGFAASPRALAIAAGNVYVVTVAAAGASWLTVMDTALTTGSPRIAIVDSIPLTGLNAGGITLGGDGYLYVVSNDGRLAIVDPASRREVAVVNGLGDQLGTPVYHPSGRVLIPSADGILEVNPATRSVTRGPTRGIKPAGDSPTVLAVDQRGRIYAVVAHCARPSQSPGAVYVLSPPPEYTLRTMITTGPCPVGAAAAAMP